MDLFLCAQLCPIDQGDSLCQFNIVFDYYSFVIKFEIEFFLLFESCLTILGSLHFHMNFTVGQFLQKGCWDFH